MNVPLPAGLARACARPSSAGCGLLVSVRDDVEAEEAIAGGATIIDVKDPSRGPLGAAACEVAVGVAAVVGRRAPWTLACGELRDGVAEIHRRVRRTIAMLPDGAEPPVAAKAGMAATARVDWRKLLATFAAGLPDGVAPVAVAYADWARAGAPRPDHVLEEAIVAGIRLLLIDTFDKLGPCVVGSAAATREVADWVRRARDAGLGVVLAGGLTAAAIPTAVACDPHVIAVRSAACVGGRQGRVCRQRVGRIGKLCGLAAGPAERSSEQRREILGGAGSAQHRP